MQKRAGSRQNPTAATPWACIHIGSSLLPASVRNYQIRIIPFRAATCFSVQKPFGSSMIGHRSERFCVFLPIFAGRDGEGNEQKLGEEWGQAKQWSQYFEKKNLPSINTSLVLTNVPPDVMRIVNRVEQTRTWLKYFLRFKKVGTLHHNLSDSVAW